MAKTTLDTTHETCSVRMEFQTHGIIAPYSMAMDLTLWFANLSFGSYQQSHF